MLVYVGTGIVVLKCCHNKPMQTVNADACCGTDNGYGVNKKCMTMTVMKLSPSVTSQKTTPQIPDIPIAGMPDCRVPSLAAVTTLTHNITGTLPEAYCNPPRKYLALIRVLII